MTLPSAEHGVEQFQAGGVVLVLDTAGLEIRHVSANAESLVGIPAEQLVGQPLSAVLDAEVVAMIADHLTRPAGEMGWQRVALHDGRPVKIHGFDPLPGQLGLDIVPAPPLQIGGAQAVERVAQWTEQLLGTTRVEELLQLATATITQLSGFEGAWAVRIEPEGHGNVLAADAPNTGDVVGQFVAATDIPPGEPWVRGRPVPFFVGDLDAEPVELVPPASSATDFAGSTLGRPYPTFLSRLSEIGVGATLSVPVVVEGVVHARLIAHHPVPHPVSPAVQAELRLVGAATGTHLSELLRLQETRERLDRATWSSRIVEAIAATGELADGLVADPAALLGLCSADTAIVSIDGRDLVVGKPLPEGAKEAALEVARARLETMDRQGNRPSAAVERHARLEAGLLRPAEIGNVVAIGLGGDETSIIVWVRDLDGVRVSWVDHRPVAADGPNPPVLFEAMQERLDAAPSTSSPWSHAQVQAVADFHAALANLIMARYQQVARLNAQLERSNDEFDAFSHAAAHDLKQPIRGIRQYTEFFVEDTAHKLTPDELGQLETVLRLTDRMGDLLDGLMRYAEQGVPGWAPEAIDLRAAVRAATELLPPSAVEAASIAVQEAVVVTDPSAFEQLVLNLVENALKYRGEEPARLTIGVASLLEVGAEAPIPDLLTDASPLTPVLVVTDRGIGIEPRHHATIFELFRQVEPGTSGSGAGLAICRRIARRQGGDIWLRSAPGEGSTFFVALPS